ncbi:MAG: G1 family glutamic endopeptidase [Ktedonobacterales bacterium]
MQADAGRRRQHTEKGKRQYSLPRERSLERSCLSKGNYNSHQFSDVTNGSTAEWIAERPSDIHGVPQHLADFRYMGFTDCQAEQNGTLKSVINLPHNYSNMTTNEGQELASTGPLYADSGDGGAHFTINWLAAGPIGS